MSIPRLSFYPDSMADCHCDVDCSEHGQYVYYDDHVKAMNADRLIRAEAFNAGWNARGDHEADRAAGKKTLPRHKWFDYWMSRLSSGA